jgi:hypothetical protein
MLLTGSGANPLLDLDPEQMPHALDLWHLEVSRSDRGRRAAGVCGRRCWWAWGVAGCWVGLPIFGGRVPRAASLRLGGPGLIPTPRWGGCENECGLYPESFEWRDGLPTVR